MTRFPLRYFRSSLQDLVRELPLRALIPLALAIFSLFALLGPVTDVLAGGSQPPWAVVRKQLLASSAALPLAEIAKSYRRRRARARRAVRRSDAAVDSKGMRAAGALTGHDGYEL